VEITLKIQDIQVTKLPLVIITDTHTNLANIQKLLDLYPDSQFICLGDITSLWDQKSDLNKLSIQFFIDNKIPTLRGNHESFLSAVDKGDKNIISNVTNKNLVRFNLNKKHLDFIESLPIGFRLNLPNGKHYLCYHNTPTDLWVFNKKRSREEFLKIYPILNGCLSVIHGHCHENSIETYSDLETKKICVGALKYDDYALLTEKGIEFKKI
jgi:predicted phosphodiesterase